MDKYNFIGKTLLIKTNEKKILVIGDLHLGYEESLNRSGIFFPRQMFQEIIEYFDKVFKKIGMVDEVVLLGDVKHEFGGISRQEWSDYLKLVEFLEKKCSKIIITRGNHDKILDFMTRKSESVELKDYYLADEFAFFHGDKNFIELHNKKIKYWVMGHAHPAIKITDGVKIEKYKCFLVGKFEKREVIIVPSFIEVNEGSDPRENDLGLAWKFNYGKFNVFIVSDENLEVLDFGLLRKL